MKTEIVKWGTKIGQEIAKNSPGILTALGVAGTVTTAVLASKATLQANKKLEDMKKHEEEGHEPFTMKEKAKSILPFYIPAAIMLLTTSACIIGSHSISTRRQMALASAYSLSTEAMKEMENKFKEVNGEKKLEKLKDDISRDRIKTAYEANKSRIINTGQGEQLFYDYYSGHIFSHDRTKIDQIFIKMNEMINQGSEVSLNMIYEEMGLPWTPLGDLVSFHRDYTGIIEPKFTPEWMDEEHTITCTEINFYNEPIPSKNVISVD